MSTFSTASWAPFFEAEAGASAALAGLLFVALSINLQRILAIPYLPGRAAETLVMLVGALTLCGAGLVPGESMTALGVEFAATGAVSWLVPTMNTLRRAPLPREIPAWRLALSLLLYQAGTLPAVVAGVLLLAGHAAGLYVVAVAVVFALLAAVLNAWVLLVEIIR